MRNCSSVRVSAESCCVSSMWSVGESRPTWEHASYDTKKVKKNHRQSNINCMATNSVSDDPPGAASRGFCVTTGIDVSESTNCCMLQISDWAKLRPHLGVSPYSSVMDKMEQYRREEETADKVRTFDAPDPTLKKSKDDFEIRPFSSTLGAFQNILFEKV